MGSHQALLASARGCLVRPSRTGRSQTYSTRVASTTSGCSLVMSHEAATRNTSRSVASQAHALWQTRVESQGHPLVSVAFASIGNRACADRSRLGRAAVLPLCCSGHQGKYRTGPRRARSSCRTVDLRSVGSGCSWCLPRWTWAPEGVGWVSGADRDTDTFTRPRRRVESLSPRARDLPTTREFLCGAAPSVAV